MSFGIHDYLCLPTSIRHYFLDISEIYEHFHYFVNLCDLIRPLITLRHYRKLEETNLHVRCLKYDQGCFMCCLCIKQILFNVNR